MAASSGWPAAKKANGRSAMRGSPGLLDEGKGLIWREVAALDAGEGEAAAAAGNGDHNAGCFWG